MNSSERSISSKPKKGEAMFQIKGGKEAWQLNVILTLDQPLVSREDALKDMIESMDKFGTQ